MSNVVVIVAQDYTSLYLMIDLNDFFQSLQHIDKNYLTENPKKDLFWIKWAILG